MLKQLILAATATLATLPAHAVEITVAPGEAYLRVTQGDKNILLVDVRDPVEIMFVGFADTVHVNVPFLLVDRSAWDDKRDVFRLYRNPDFIRQIQAELDRRGLGKDAEIITLCRSGSERGEPSAALLRANGFPNARFVIDGFQGPAIKDGPQAGLRILSGWQNSGLPWSSRMNPDKMHRTDRRP
jgi:rhodanese-related sulfurtransferase